MLLSILVLGLQSVALGMHVVYIYVHAGRILIPIKKKQINLLDRLIKRSRRVTNWFRTQDRTYFSPWEFVLSHQSVMLSLLPNSQGCGKSP